jgi:hypothetical protein
MDYFCSPCYCWLYMLPSGCFTRRIILSDKPRRWKGIRHKHLNDKDPSNPSNRYKDCRISTSSHPKRFVSGNVRITFWEVNDGVCVWERERNENTTQDWVSTLFWFFFSRPKQNTFHQHKNVQLFESILTITWWFIVITLFPVPMKRMDDP